ncbi:hypothetical protein BC781_10257 [Sediminitomix flava]|uniref:Uncharacterized protein n=1 Tax=Sediminitomix flava TaxID=379075 RepID=A0A315ZAA5_SEDFL|nr:hypothetical protein BC781_10257 [Sediminitomix flava]
MKEYGIAKDLNTFFDEKYYFAYNVSRVIYSQIFELYSELIKQLAFDRKSNQP